MLALSACSPSGSGSGSSAEPKTLTIGAAWDIESFDPALLSTEGGDYPQIWGAVYDTLLRLEPDGSLSPDLATEWKYNDDNTVLTLKLRDDVTFTDGTAFDANTVKANIEHFIAGTGQTRYSADAIQSVEVISGDEVAIHLSVQDPVLTRNLASALGAMASADALKSPDIALKPVGSGPYVLDSDKSAKGTEYVFERNAGYWDTASWPYDEVVIKVMTDVNARLNALISGQIDAGRLNPTLMSQAQSQGLTVYQNPVDWVGLTLFDRAGELVPALGDLRVRQAMNMAFDRDAMLKSLDQGMGSVTEQIVGQQSTAYDESLNSTYSYDVDKAEALMADAGYADGFSLTMPDTPRAAPYEPYVEKALGSIGITVTWQSQTDEAATDAYLNGDLPAMIFANAASANSFEALNLAYQSTINALHSSDPEFTSLIEKGRTTQGDDSTAAYRDANAWLVQNAWFVPWYYTDIIYASSTGVTVKMQAGDAGPQLRSYTPAG
jgi:peptide/nickel transport system substrate-binding protein